MTDVMIVNSPEDSATLPSKSIILLFITEDLVNQCDSLERVNEARRQFNPPRVLPIRISGDARTIPAAFTHLNELSMLDKEFYFAGLRKLICEIHGIRAEFPGLRKIWEDFLNELPTSQRLLLTSDHAFSLKVTSEAPKSAVATCTTASSASSVSTASSASLIGSFGVLAGPPGGPSVDYAGAIHPPGGLRVTR